MLLFLVRVIESSKKLLGPALTSTTKFFSEEMETTRESVPKDQHVAGSRLNYGLYLFKKP